MLAPNDVVPEATIKVLLSIKVSEPLMAELPFRVRDPDDRS